MSLYRVKQFYWSMVSKIDKSDEEIINKYLDEEEKALFQRLSTYEQKHSINVAREVLKNDKKDNIVDKTLVKAGLLHDIGKGFKKLNPIEKSILVMMDNITNGKLRKFKSLKVIDVYYNHGDKGYKMLKEIGKYDERFLYLVKNHHNEYIIGDKQLDLLKKCDSNN